MPLRRLPLSQALILDWADDHLRRTGRFPTADSGAVYADPNEKWGNLDQALRMGLRGLPGKDSLAKLLKRERGRRHRHELPQPGEQVILAWAHAHREATGAWPTE